MALYAASVLELLIHYLLRTLIYNSLFLSFSYLGFEIFPMMVVIATVEIEKAKATDVP